MLSVHSINAISLHCKRCVPLLICRNASLFSLGNNHNNKFNLKSKPLSNHPASIRFFSVESARDIYLGWFKTITESDTVGACKDGLITLHEVTGLSWGSTIILTTLCLRLFFTFPLGIYQTYVMAKLELCRIEFKEIINELKGETALAIKKFNLSEKQARAVYHVSAKKQWRLLVERDNCHPLKTTLVLWVQIPVWVILSLALRCMSYQYGQDPIQSAAVAEELSVEGLAWIPNLLVPDPTFILPVTMCVANLLIVELQAASKENPSRAQKILTNVFRGLALVTLPIAVSVPSCMSLYWSVSSLLALTQNACLLSPRLRDACAIPHTSTYHPHPYQRAWKHFTNKLSFRRQ